MGFLQIIGAALCWSLSAPYVKWIGLPIPYLTSIRCLVPTLVMGGIIYSNLGIRRIFTPASYGGVWSWHTTMASLFNLVRSILYFWGFSVLPVGHAILLIYTWPIIISLLNWILFKERLTLFQWAMAITALVGIILIEVQPMAMPTERVILGSIGVIIAAMCNAGMILTLQRTPQPISKTEQVFIQNCFGGLVFLPVFLRDVVNVSPVRTGISIIMAVIVGVVGFALFFSALRKIPTGQAAILSYIEIVFTLIIATLFLNEHYTPIQWFGGFLIVLGSVGAQVIQRPIPRQHPRD